MQWSVPALFIFCATAPLAGEPVVVLPFHNESEVENLDWVGESLAETVQEALRSRGILVLHRRDRDEVYRRLSIRPNAHLTHASLMKVAEALDASDLVYGEFEFIPGEGTRGTLRIVADRVNIARLQKGDEFIESGPLEELGAMQSRLAWRILRELAPDLTASEEEFLRERPPVRLDAMENYTRGLITANPEQKHRYFAQAARLDERFSEPSFELGRMHWERQDYRVAADWLARIGPGAPRFLEASFLLGLSRYSMGDYAGAERAFQLVAAGVPLNEVYNDLGAAQSRLNRPAALDNFRKALEGDAADPDYHFNVGYALWKRGRYDEAAASFRAALDRNPEDAAATLMLGRCLRRTPPKPADAAENLERLKLNYEEGAYRQLKAALQGAKRR